VRWVPIRTSFASCSLSTQDRLYPIQSQDFNRTPEIQLPTPLLTVSRQRSSSQYPLGIFLKAIDLSFLRRLTDGTKKKALFYYASSSLICQALRFIGVLITTRLIAPEQFGLFAQAALLMSFAGLLREIGQTGALVAYQGTDQRYAYFNFQTNLLLGCVASALTVSACLLLKIVPLELRSLAWVLAAIPLAESLTFTNVLMLQKRFRFRALGIIEIICLCVWLATVGLLVGRAPGLSVLLYAQLAEFTCRCLLLFAVARLEFIGFANGSDLRHYYFYQFARPVIPLVVINGLLGRVDYLLLSIFSTRMELGVYERLGQFSRIPMSLTINLCDKVLMHSYSHAQADRRTLTRMLRKSMLVMAAGVVVITALVTLFLLIFLPHLIGRQWSPIIMRLWWYGLPVILFTPILANISLFFSGLGAQTQLLKNTVLNLITDVVFGLLFVAGLGAAGMLIAKSISGLFALIYQATALQSRLKTVEDLSKQS
jgi:PST family polysaccharide transporter